MNIIINHNGENYIHNLAFIKAILIKEYIENMNISLESKEQIKQEILTFLQKN